VRAGRGAASFVDLAPREESFRHGLVTGLSRPKKAISCKFLYDEHGSALFEAICATPEYYPTRTELGILENAAPEIAALLGPDCALVEFGSGNSRKVRVLLDALPSPRAYLPVDISRELLQHAANGVAADYPRLEVIAVCADYTDEFRLPRIDGARGLAGFFPGSTIGNFEPAEAVAFLRRAGRTLGSGGAFLVGVDLKKDRAVLDAAYNDRAGVTAAFSLNLLARANAELGADFDLQRFEHEAFYEPRQGRVEIYLKSLAEQEVRVAGRIFRFHEGERIHTEHSYKYTVDEFARLAASAGFEARRCWTDEDRLFSVHLLEA
jgi:dimethylhistidine N-methyltransferase